MAVPGVLFAREIAPRVLSVLKRPCDPVLLKNVETSIRNVLKTKLHVACRVGCRCDGLSPRNSATRFVWRIGRQFFSGNFWRTDIFAAENFTL